MIRVVLLVVLTGCSLYYGSADNKRAPDAGFVEPPPPDAYLELCYLFVCQGDTEYALDPIWHVPGYPCVGEIDWDSKVAVATCEHGCRHGRTYEHGPTPCVSPPPPTYDADCPAPSGTCFLNDTFQCKVPDVKCGFTAAYASCTCGSGGWSCSDGCADSMCTPGAVQQAIAGTWSGTVSRPEISLSYSTTLTIAADGHWSATNEAFYYGGLGGGPGNSIFIQAQTSAGAYGSVRLWDETPAGELHNIRVEPTRLRFTFVNSWNACHAFQFDLQRL